MGGAGTVTGAQGFGNLIDKQSVFIDGLARGFNDQSRAKHSKTVWKRA